MFSQAEVWFLNIVVTVLALYAGFTLKAAANKIMTAVDKIAELDKRITVIEVVCPKIHTFKNSDCDAK